MFESGTYQSQPEHVALYEALEASMEHDNRDEFLVEKDKLRKRRRDDQDPPPPPTKESGQSKKKKQDSDASGSKQTPAQTSSAWKTLREYMCCPSSKDQDQTRLANAFATSYKDPKENKLLQKTSDMGSFIKWYYRQIGKSKLNKADLEGPAYKDLEYLVSGSKERRSALSISKLKAANYLDFRLEELIPSLWIECE
ncbi:hypothetical protein Tco_1250445 [Tanacetum coccineum]